MGGREERRELGEMLCDGRMGGGGWDEVIEIRQRAGET